MPSASIIKFSLALLQNLISEIVREKHNPRPPWIRIGGYNINKTPLKENPIFGKTLEINPHGWLEFRSPQYNYCLFLFRLLSVNSCSPDSSLSEFKLWQQKRTFGNQKPWMWAVSAHSPLKATLHFSSYSFTLHESSLHELVFFNNYYQCQMHLMQCGKRNQSSFSRTIGHFFSF